MADAGRPVEAAQGLFKNQQPVHGHGGTGAVRELTKSRQLGRSMREVERARTMNLESVAKGRSHNPHHIGDEAEDPFNLLREKRRRALGA
jgi:hypothetical protein